MGFQEIKHGVEEEEEEADPTEIWVIAGISLRAPLKPVKTSTSTKPTSTTTNDVDDDDDGLEEEEEEETPVRRPAPEGTVISCPPAPKKPKPPVGCRLEGVEFFSVPDDLRAVFVLRQERISK